MRNVLIAVILLAGCAEMDEATAPCTTLTAYDGDTVKCDGVSMRPMGPGSPDLDGFDTPEIHSRARCDEEHDLGIIARDRMRELIKTPGLVIERAGQKDQFDRELVWLRLPIGETIGELLLREGHARPPRKGLKNDWCGKPLA